MAAGQMSNCECHFHDDSCTDAVVQDVSSDRESYLPRPLYMRCVREAAIPWNIRFICIACVQKVSSQSDTNVELPPTAAPPNYIINDVRVTNSNVGQIQTEGPTTIVLDIQPAPSPARQATIACDYSKVVQELIAAQAQNQTKDAQFYQVTMDNVPVVHPKLIKESYYDGVEHKPIRSSKLRTPDRSTEVSFDDILNHVSKPGKSVALAGLSGAGKTTLTRRLCQNGEMFCFFMKFQHMNYGEEKMTLRELLVDRMYPHLSKAKCRGVYRWIVSNQMKCIFALDGFDQVRWRLEHYPNYRDAESKQTVSQLISNLFAKRLLPRVRLIFTTRPHSLLSIPCSLRPDVTILLSDFTDENTKFMFHALAGTKAPRMWSTLEAKCPQILHLCHNPLMLQIVVNILLTVPEFSIENIRTMTRVFRTMMRNLILRNEHPRGYSLKEIKNKLAKVAFDASERECVLITADHLNAESLDVNTVKDLVIFIPGSASPPQRLFGEGPNLFFAHLSLQEFFAASHLIHETLQSQPRLPKFITSPTGTFFSSRWSLIRRFYCGLLVDIETSHDYESISEPSSPARLQRDESVGGGRVTRSRSLLDVLTWRPIENNAQEARRKFTEKLLQEFKTVTREVSSPRTDAAQKKLLIDHVIDVRECNDDVLTKTLSEKFPARIDLNNIPLTSSDTHAIGCVLQRVTKTIEKLNLNHCTLSSHAFSNISSSIVAMPGKIEQLDIRYNALNSEGVYLICSIMPKVTKTLNMIRCFSDDGSKVRNANQQEQQLLQRCWEGITATNLELLCGAPAQETECKSRQ